LDVSGHSVAQHAVLGHGKAMPLWQGQYKVVRIESFHG
jgi:hypothetical protein